jgi:predicted aconitase
LTADETAVLEGAGGLAAQKAMQMVTALGEIYGAERLVPIVSAQISGVSYKNLGETGIQFLEEWAREGARVCVPAFMNPAGMDLERWQEMAVSAEFAGQQKRLVKALRAMGITPTCSCTPYLTGHIPRIGDSLAWSESSAVSYANSVLGARTNREGGPSALAAAIVGRTADYGLHRTENRRPTHLIQVQCALRGEADYGALGYGVGLAVRDGVPFYRFSQPPPGGAPTQEHLMALGAAMAASGAVAMYHIQGITPEAMPQTGALDHLERLPTITIDSLAASYAALNSPVEHIDFVALGCPHSTLADIERTAVLLSGKRLTATLWVTTSRHVRRQAVKRGWVADIERAGGHVFADTCLVVAPVEGMGYRAMATNSAKSAFYAPSHSKLERRFGSLEQCIEAGLTGRWRVRDSEGDAA